MVRNRYPKVVFRERKVVYSSYELLERIKEGMKSNKLCIVSLYSFEEIRDKQPIWESARIDSILFEGTLELCERKCKEFSSYPSVIIFDGEKHLAIIYKNSTLEELKRLGANTSLKKMIILPGCLNLKTGKRSKIVRKYGREI